MHARHKAVGDDAINAPDFEKKLPALAAGLLLAVVAHL
jgi:hypothetical protein